ncbi:MAG: hypothetical protein ACMG51_10215 [Ginsengibacter sp.]
MMQMNPATLSALQASGIMKDDPGGGGNDPAPGVAPPLIAPLPPPGPNVAQDPSPIAPVTNTPTTGGGPTIAGLIDGYNAFTGQAGKNAQAVANAADPFASQRGQYQKQLSGLMSDPSTFTMDPGTIFAENQGNQAITAAANAQGVTRGGSVVADIGKYDTGIASQAYNTRISQLLALSGAAPGNPGAAALAIQTGQTNQQGNTAGALASLGQYLTSQGIAQGSSLWNQALSHFGLGGNLGSSDPGQIAPLPPPGPNVPMDPIPNGIPNDPTQPMDPLPPPDPGVVMDPIPNGNPGSDGGNGDSSPYGDSFWTGATP